MIARTRTQKYVPLRGSHRGTKTTFLFIDNSWRQVLVGALYKFLYCFVAGTIKDDEIDARLKVIDVYNHILAGDLLRFHFLPQCIYNAIISIGITSAYE
jgi:hypothetical protein